LAGPGAGSAPQRPHRPHDRRHVIELAPEGLNLSEDLTLLCEEIVPLVFHGTVQSPQWIEGDQAEALLSTRPDANLSPSLVDQQLPLLLGGLTDLQTALGTVATQRAALQLQAHERVREATRHRAKVRIEPVQPVDILGAYLLLPVL